MKNKEKILRCYNGEFRARQEDGKGIIEGYAIVYDSLTDLGYFEEIITKGALKNCDLKDVRFLVNHDTTMIPLARSRNNNENSTMQLIVDDRGLTIIVRLDLENNADARSLYSAIERGDITGMSFMFIVRKEEWDETDREHPKRTILEIEKVFEVSAVTFPAYEDTEINARCKAELESYRSTLENVPKRNAPDGESIDDIELIKLKTKIKLDLNF